MAEAIRGRVGALEHLGVAGNPLDEQGIEPLLEVLGDAPLRSVDFSRIPIFEDGLLALAGTPWCGTLRHCALEDAGVGDAAFTALCARWQSRELRRLALSDNAVSDLRPLAGMRSLEHLEMRHNPIEGKHLGLLGEALHGLRSLDLGRCALRDQDVFELWQRGRMGSLVFLGLADNGLTIDAVLNFQWSDTCRRLKGLDLAHNPRLSSAVLAPILRAAVSLEVLNLSGIPSAGQGLSDIASPWLRRLTLSEGALDEEALDAFIGSGRRFERLEALDVSRNALSTESLNRLTTWDGMPALGHLIIGADDATPEARASLTRTLAARACRVTTR